MGEHLPIEQRIAEASRRWPGFEFKRKTRTEAAGPCPFGGTGTDRFVIWSNGRYLCRQCGAEGWLDENDAHQMTDEERLALRVAALEHKQAEHERRLSALERMAQCTDHLRYHREMPAHAREYWWSEGMTDDTIDRYLLGWCPSCPTCRESPSYTIPVFAAGTLRNIRHRLASPVGGKYRPHIAGLGNQLFNADVLRATERVLIVEGAKKAIIMTQAGFPAVGIMGKSAFKVEWVRWFDGVGDVCIALDPDAIESAERLGRGLAKRGLNVRVADFPAKPDDYAVKHGAGAADIEAVLDLARPVRID